MNERIQQLAEQALNEYSATYHNEAKIPEAYLNKFAELIVNKCANIVWDEAEKIDSHEVNNAGYKIIEHFFGVEK